MGKWGERQMHQSSEAFIARPSFRCFTPTHSIIGWEESSEKRDTSNGVDGRLTSLLKLAPAPDDGSRASITTNQIGLSMVHLV